MCPVMSDCDANKGTNNLTDKESISLQPAAVNTSRSAYHTSVSVPNALHILSSLNSSIGHRRQDFEETSRSNTISSTLYNNSYENMNNAESYGERERVSFVKT